jgi:ribosomal protein L37E
MNGRVAPDTTQGLTTGRLTTPSPGAPARPVRTTCPRCGGQLRFPESHAICISCGYSRGQEAIEKNKPKQSSSDIVEFFKVVRDVPGWFWLLFFGAVALFAAAIVGDMKLAANRLPRALVGTIGTVGGVIAFFAAQTWALCQLMPTTEDLGALDALYPFRIWPAIWNHMPRSKKPVTLATWGVTAAVCFGLIVNGMGYWLPKKTKPLVARGGTVIQRTNDDVYADDDKPEPGEEKVVKEETPKDDDEEKKDAEVKDDVRPMLRCVVIGYIPGKAGKLPTLVIAREIDGALQYAGTVNHGLSGQRGKDVVGALTGLVRPEPAIPGLEVKAVWVEPRLFCDIHQGGQAATGLLIDPRFENLVKPEPKQQPAQQEQQ